MNIKNRHETTGTKGLYVRIIIFFVVTDILQSIGESILT